MTGSSWGFDDAAELARLSHLSSGSVRSTTEGGESLYLRHESADASSEAFVQFKDDTRVGSISQVNPVRADLRAFPMSADRSVPGVPPARRVAAGVRGFSPARVDARGKVPPGPGRIGVRRHRSDLGGFVLPVVVFVATFVVLRRRWT